MTQNTLTIREIVRQFTNLHGSNFVGIKGYTSSTTGETANHVVIADFDYGKAVEKDLNKLLNATSEQVQTIARKNNLTPELVKTAIDKLSQAFIKNMNSETQSAQSAAQQAAYLPITNSIKLHIESGKLHIFALSVSKDVLVEGEYKVTNKRELTIAQDAVKKHFEFSTAKYRNFIIDRNQLAGVNISGEKITLK